MMVNAKTMGIAIQKLFGETAEEEAHKTKLVQRASKLTGVIFLKVWVLGFLENPTASLNFLSQVAEDLGVIITRQGIQERLKATTVAFMKRMFEHAIEHLQNRVPLPLKLLAQFTAVQLLDSTGIALPDNLADKYPACGGDGPEAGLKLQVLWDFLCGNLTALFQTTGREPDQSFKKHLGYIAKGGLYLADLGYFVLSTLQAVADKGAYFISRFNHQTGLVDPITGERFDLLTYLHKTSADKIELDLWLGLKVRLPVRLLAVRLPFSVVEERCRKAKANAKKKGRTLSADALAWLEWSIYVTNVPADMLTLAQVTLLYTLRWQIELLFKLWKSEGQLNRVAGTLSERILCEIYAKLIGMVLFHFITAPVRWEERELSPTKALQTFRRDIHIFRDALSSPTDLTQVLNRLFQRWRRHAMKDKRRTGLSTCRKIELAAAQTASSADLLPCPSNLLPS